MTYKPYTPSPTKVDGARTENQDFDAKAAQQRQDLYEQIVLMNTYFSLLTGEELTLTDISRKL